MVLDQAKSNIIALLRTLARDLRDTTCAQLVDLAERDGLPAEEIAARAIYILATDKHELRRKYDALVAMVPIGTITAEGREEQR